MITFDMMESLHAKIDAIQQTGAEVGAVEIYQDVEDKLLVIVTVMNGDIPSFEQRRFGILKDANIIELVKFE